MIAECKLQDAPRSRPVGVSMMVFLGVILSVIVINGPWGNGVIAAGIFLGCVIVLPLLTFALLRFTRLRAWPARGIALIVTFALFTSIAFISARPPKRSTLAYMIGGPLPANVECTFLRCKWFDGQIYVARFHADAPAVTEILAQRTYAPVDLTIDAAAFATAWKADFQLAGIADQSWAEPPLAHSPRIFTWDTGQITEGRSESARILIDDATSDCWMQYDWT